jgi:hypothetical protein
MATWVRQGTGTAPSATNADLIGNYALDNATAPGDFDPAGVTSVRTEWTITGSGFGDDSWDNVIGVALVGGVSSTEIGQHPGEGSTGNKNVARSSDHTDSTGIPAGLTVADWEAAFVRGDGAADVWCLWNKVMGPDGSTLAASSLTVTITYTPGSASNPVDIDPPSGVSVGASLATILAFVMAVQGAVAPAIAVSPSPVVSTAAPATNIDSPPGVAVAVTGLEDVAASAVVDVTSLPAIAVGLTAPGDMSATAEIGVTSTSAVAVSIAAPEDVSTTAGIDIDPPSAAAVGTGKVMVNAQAVIGITGPAGNGIGSAVPAAISLSELTAIAALPGVSPAIAATPVATVSVTVAPYSGFGISVAAPSDVLAEGAPPEVDITPPAGVAFGVSSAASTVDVATFAPFANLAVGLASPPAVVLAQATTVDTPVGMAIGVGGATVDVQAQVVADPIASVSVGIAPQATVSLTALTAIAPRSAIAVGTAGTTTVNVRLVLIPPAGIGLGLGHVDVTVQLQRELDSVSAVAVGAASTVNVSSAAATSILPPPGVANAAAKPSAISSLIVADINPASGVAVGVGPDVDVQPRRILILISGVALGIAGPAGTAAFVPIGPEWPLSVPIEWVLADSGIWPLPSGE